MNAQNIYRLWGSRFCILCGCVVVVWCSIQPAIVFAQYEKPGIVFDRNSAQRTALAEKLKAEFVKLWDSPQQVQGILATKDKQGTIRIEHTAQDSLQNSCLENTFMYFSNKEVWLGTEEYFVQQPNEDRTVGELFRGFGVLLQHKGFKIHPCNKSGRDALWKYTLPSQTWYECEIIHHTPGKKHSEAVYGTAVFNDKGELIQIKPLAKK